MATPAPPAALPRRHYFLTAALATLLFLPGIFTKDFLLFNEGRRAIIGLELYQRHEWLVPRLMGEPILTKPPFFYWLEVISYKVFHGSSDWAARIPSVIAAVAGLLAFLRLTAVLLGVEAALFGTAVLATSPIYFAMAQSAEPEMVFVALGTLGLASAIPPLLTNRPSSGAIIIALFFVGLSFFTKGPFVPVSVVLALLGWMILAGKIRAVSPLAWIVGTVLA
ncbi:glycosyltransferase family 39 protein, partial [Candidatus Sumerlaeota bacterium]|nr:glycosyltransferase family 39 protein [Candidatus Sumerlaeota bacterium]